MKPEDDLMDALLKEQARKRDADEVLLGKIDEAIDSGGAEKRKTHRMWLPLSAAAAVAFAGVWIYQARHDRAPDLAYHQVKEAPMVTPEPRFSTERMAVESRGMAVQAEPAAVTDERALDVRQAGVPEEEVADMPTGMNRAMASNSKPLSIEADPAEDRLDHLLDELPLEGAERNELEGILSDASKEERDQVALGLIETKRAMEMLRKERSSRLKVQKPDSIGGGGGALQSEDGQEMDALMDLRDAAKKELLPGMRGRIVDPGEDGEHRQNLNRERYGQLIDQPWKSSWEEPLSTFSIDVDTASYTNLRRAIREGRKVQPDAVRIEECINYFDYRYEAPRGDKPFSVKPMLVTCPWQPNHLLARVAIKGREVEKNARPASNLVFLIDVSGSMQSPDKLHLLKRSMEMLVGELDERDRVGIVVYAGADGVVLSPTILDEDGKKKALSAIGKLESGGSTNGGAGIQRAYKMALENMREGGVNRVILASDGDFNVGVSGTGELVKLVKARAAKGVNLSVLGFGTGNLNDEMMEQISNDGNGNYFYIDGNREAKRVLLNKLSGTLVTIAKDVKIQVDFNPGKVKAYRLIGYANRVLRNQDFNNDKVDAGDIGAGHTVTAFYEIVPVGVPMPDTGNVDDSRYQKSPEPEPKSELVASDEWLTVKLRYKHPEGEKSRLLEIPVKGEGTAFEEAGRDFHLAAAVAMFGMKLREDATLEDFSWNQIADIAKPALADDPEEQRAEFVEMLRKME